MCPEMYFWYVIFESPKVLMKAEYKIPVDDKWGICLFILSTWRWFEPICLHSYRHECPDCGDPPDEIKKKSKILSALDKFPKKV